MKAVAVYPGKKNSVHLEDIPRPGLGDAPQGRGVLVRVLKVGVDATDKEINDATGSSQLAFDAMEALGHNGVLVWTSITGGDRRVDIPSDRINLDWVLGNKLLLGSVNANREHFESGIKDLALGEVMYPGVIQKILTHPVDGLDGYQEMMRLLVEDNSALKVYVNVADE